MVLFGSLPLASSYFVLNEAKVTLSFLVVLHWYGHPTPSPFVLIITSRLGLPEYVKITVHEYSFPKRTVYNRATNRAWKRLHQGGSVAASIPSSTLGVFNVNGVIVTKLLHEADPSVIRVGGKKVYKGFRTTKGDPPYVVKNFSLEDQTARTFYRFCDSIEERVHEVYRRQGGSLVRFEFTNFDEKNEENNVFRKALAQLHKTARPARRGRGGSCSDDDDSFGSSPSPHRRPRTRRRSASPRRFSSSSPGGSPGGGGGGGAGGGGGRRMSPRPRYPSSRPGPSGVGPSASFLPSRRKKTQPKKYPTEKYPRRPKSPSDSSSYDFMDFGPDGGGSGSSIVTPGFNPYIYQPPDLPPYVHRLPSAVSPSESFITPSHQADLDAAAAARIRLGAALRAGTLSNQAADEFARRARRLQRTGNDPLVIEHSPRMASSSNTQPRGVSVTPPGRSRVRFSESESPPGAHYSDGSPGGRSILKGLKGTPLSDSQKRDIFEGATATVHQQEAGQMALHAVAEAEGNIRESRERTDLIRVSALVNLNNPSNSFLEEDRERLQRQARIGRETARERNREEELARRRINARVAGGIRTSTPRPDRPGSFHTTIGDISSIGAASASAPRSFAQSAADVRDLVAGSRRRGGITIDDSEFEPVDAEVVAEVAAARASNRDPLQERPDFRRIEEEPDPRRERYEEDRRTVQRLREEQRAALQAITVGGRPLTSGTGVTRIDRPARRAGPLRLDVDSEDEFEEEFDPSVPMPRLLELQRQRTHALEQAAEANRSAAEGEITGQQLEQTEERVDRILGEINRREGVAREATEERHEEEEEQMQADAQVEELERNIEEEQAQIQRLAEEIRLERLRAESHLSEVQPSLIEENPEAAGTDEDEFASDEEEFQGALAQLPGDFFPDLPAIEQFPDPYDSEAQEIDTSGGPIFRC